MEETQQRQPTGVTFEATAKGQIAFLAPDGAGPCLEPNQREPCTVSPDDEEKKEETQRQAWFENAIKKKLNIPNSYVQVAPLIIRWHPNIDEHSRGHTDEIRDLKKVFKRFGFSEASEVYLDQEQAQHTLTAAIATHIRHNDGPNKLMIIYYTGHGILDKHGQLQLAARLDLGQTAAAYWHKAELPLLDPVDMKADVLAILDCCYASDAHKGSRGDRKIYDLLAACPPGEPTPAPGARSFSRRLINTLNRLLDEDNGQRILTTRLMKEMNQIGVDSRKPVRLHDRLHKGINDGRHVQLVRINRDSKSKTKEDAILLDEKPTEGASVTLRFSFENPMVKQDKIETWAHRLIKACDGEEDVDIALRRIDWVKMEKTAPGKRFLDLVNTVIATGPRDHFRKAVKRVIRSNNASGRSRKRIRSRDLPSVVTKRQALGKLSTPGNRSSSRLLTPQGEAGSPCGGRC